MIYSRGRFDRVPFALLALILCAVSRPIGAQITAAQRRADTRWAATLERRFPCRKLPTKTFVANDINPKTACSLVSAALNEISSGRAIVFGVRPESASLARRISVSGLFLRGLAGASDDAFWSVKLDFGESLPMIDVRFDRVARMTTAYRAEGRDATFVRETLN